MAPPGGTPCMVRARGGDFVCDVKTVTVTTRKSVTQLLRQVSPALAKNEDQESVSAHSLRTPMAKVSGHQSWCSLGRCTSRLFDKGKSLTLSTVSVHAFCTRAENYLPWKLTKMYSEQENRSTRPGRCRPGMTCVKSLVVANRAQSRTTNKQNGLRQMWHEVNYGGVAAAVGLTLYRRICQHTPRAA
ncbi:hypothetical protein BaRGS_00005652 [Batillaria attramentaria]|uniref:Uncharacterized protein n=1 Tax=Batillaria attramentaria TaxID=370345 RepID=A0ABD0LVA3_9CAEN